MSHDWVYVRLPASHLSRARAERAYALCLAEAELPPAEADGSVERIDLPHLIANDIWCVLSPEKRSDDPHGNGSGDTLVGSAMVGDQVLNDEISLPYGRSHTLDPSRVQLVSAWLADVSLTDFRLRASDLVAAGHRLWADLGLLDEHYTRLQTFYSLAAERQQMVIVTPL